ncbi:MAG: TrmH family RNA methyltransferase [Acidobacteriota bacterium]
MPFRLVQSKQNARLKELRRALARPGPGALAGIEGPNLLAEALRAGLRLACVFAAEDAEKLVEDLHLPSETEVLLLPRTLLDAALTTESPQPVAALVDPPQWRWEQLLQNRATAPLILVLAGLQDPGNLGTILRSAEAFGASGVCSLPGTVSAWNPNAVRASAGSLFRIPLVAAGAEECFARLRAGGVKMYATVVETAEPEGLPDLTGPTALIIGNEGSGLAEALAAQADARVTIPCPGPVESLNAAVAASVLLYEASRQRAGAAGAPFLGHGGSGRGASQ